MNNRLVNLLLIVEEEVDFSGYAISALLDVLVDMAYMTHLTTRDRKVIQSNVTMEVLRRICK